jgi:hypothetical protein
VTIWFYKSFLPVARHGELVVNITLFLEEEQWNFV